MKARVLVVEDELEVRKLLHAVLAADGFEAIEAPDGEAALADLGEHKPDLVILDVGLPRLQGWEVLEKLRMLTSVPVLMLTGLDSEADRVRALRMGADDYLGKPFGRHELVARVEALLRRARREVSDCYDDGVTVINFPRRLVSISGQIVETTPGEFDLLAALVRDPGVVLSIAQLTHEDDDGEMGASTVKTRVHRLRKKLEAAGVSSCPIEAVRGLGYRYRVPYETARRSLT